MNGYSAMFHPGPGHKVVLVLLCLGVLFTPACGKENQDPVARIKQAGVLRIVMDPSFPPFEFIDQTGTVAGLDVDLGREIARQLGVQAEFVVLGYDGLYDALTAGRADIILSALYPDLARSADFAFTPPYFNAGEMLVVPVGSPITTLDNLAGQRVAVVFGTEGHMEALRWEQTFTPPPILLTPDAPDKALAMLATHEADAAVVDNVTAQTALAQGAALQVLDPAVTDEVYVVAGRQADVALIKAISTILVQMQADGTLAALITRWMK